MKKLVLLILVVALLLSGCGIPRAVMTDTEVIDRSSEPVNSINPHATTETTHSATITSSMKTVANAADPIQDVSQTNWQPCDETTQAPSETTEIATQTLIETTETEPQTTSETTETKPQTTSETTETKPQTTSETTHKTTEIPGKTTAETTADPTPAVSQTTSQPSEETSSIPVETSQKVVETTKETDNATTVDLEYLIMLKRDVLVLMIAYPESVAGVEMLDNQAYLVMMSGSRILYDDKKVKSFEEKITDADLQDMLETLYPLSETNTLMSTNFDPGRTRAYAFLDELYGSSKDAISGKLISVDFGEEHLLFNKEAGAADALAAVAAGAARLVAEQPQIANYLYPSSGTFNYRVIAGTNRLSPHAYGIAIDLKSSPYGYWLWASPAEGETLIKTYPQDLVRLFERNGFIWGGKWNHFDVYHFEYRPEIIIKATYFSDEIDRSKPWYLGIKMNSEAIGEMIALIDKSLG